MPPAPLRIAFIGAGNMAGLHVRALRRVRTPHTVVAVHDVDRAAAEALASQAGARACATLAELLGGTRPDVVHVCTPAGTHFAPARAALAAGAHVYVEKPFVETVAEAEALFDLAAQQGRRICAGHQLVRDPAFCRLLHRAADLERITLVDSSFAFRPPRLDPARAGRRALARQLVDILPHPLYTLLAALERLAPPGVSIDVVHAEVTPTDLHALLEAGPVRGRLHVSLCARPVASTLTVVGTGGSLTADFVRAILTGAGNPGTSPLEKIANPFLEAAQIAGRSALSLARRFTGGGAYPGLVELMDEFYAAVARGGPSPLSVEHLRRVTTMHAELAGRVLEAAGPAFVPRGRASGPVAVVTGAGGFFGRRICRHLAARGFRVRGIGRSEPPDDPHIHAWVRADLAADIPASALTGAAVLVHAAAETAGGFDAHTRNTVGVTRRLLDAARAARVRRLVYVSSISVLRPPASLRERQSERTPLARRPERLGPYTWGKCAAEELVAAAGQGLDVRIIRPAALIDWDHPDFPGLLGRRLFATWHLGLGRPGLPFAICDVDQAGAAVAWYAANFDAAPAVVNLLDPAVRTRGDALRVLRAHGWRGRMVWVPISAVAGAATALMRLLALARGGRTRPPSVWGVLRPRRYDPLVSAGVFAALAQDAAAGAQEETVRERRRAKYA